MRASPRLRLTALRRGTFGRSVAVLVGGAAGAQAVNVVVSPILTRVYSPSEIGQLGLFLTMIYVASMVVTLRYDQAIVVPATLANASRVAVIALVVVTPATVVASTIFVLLILSGTGGYDELPLWTVLLLTLSLGSFGVYGVLRYWLIRLGQFDVLARVNVTQSLSRGAAQMILGASGFGLAGLLAGDLLGRAVGLRRMVHAAIGTLRAAYDEPIGMPVRRIAASYAKFPLVGAPSSLLNALAFSVPVPLLTLHYGIGAAGFFVLVQRVLGLPLSVIGASVADAFLGRMAADSRQGAHGARDLFQRAGLGLLAVGFPIAAVVAIFGPGMFEFVFGSQWRQAGVLAAVMSPWYLAALVTSPLSRVVVVYERQLSKLAYDVLSLAVAIGSITVAAARGDDMVTAVWYLTLGQVGSYSVYLVILYRLVPRGDSDATRRGAG